jgi:hypothetical protein
MVKLILRHRALLVYVGLILGGIGLHYWPSQWPPDWHWLGEVKTLLGHALIVAGILGGTVDSFLKAALIRDVGSIFIGWALPQEVRNYIRDVSQTSIVRRNCALHYRLTVQGAEAIVDVTDECDVYNYSTALRKYRPAMAADRCENPDENAIEYQATYRGSTRLWSAAQLNTSKRRAVTPQLIRWHAPKEMWLSPQDIGEQQPACRTRWKYRIRVPINGSTVASFGTPTLGVTVTVDAPPELEVVCKESDDLEHALGSNVWRYPGLFMGRHVRVYWRPK